ncbi:hypothetical protein J31TS4_11960 [Paenibacillus sp. J31TS4]|uniref:DUF3800 domain-containing protein n=1 Tax=Paenibacillus sp. J31TS4 TaxID=2807195 RepID=UPI001B05EB51|nr:DUF3800 domain-containing protein [Paenibacillus sp. J31TS4]GIP37916.1 hypothetical protein J31TS4_11960 [Paenibacillus sp. J31TS4]
MGHAFDFYCDESGNSGGDFWNKDQPVYVLAGWLIKKEERFKVDGIVNKYKEKYYPYNKELKAKDIIETDKGAIFLVEIFTHVGQYATPFFYLAEKRYLVAAKLVEAFFDPAHNEQLSDDFTWLNKVKKEIAQKIYDKCYSTIDAYAELYKRPSLDLLHGLHETFVRELELKEESELANVVRGAIPHLDTILWEEEYGLTSLPKKASKTVNYPVFEALCNLLEHFARQQNIHKIRIFHDEIAQLEKAYLETFNIHRNAGKAIFQYQDGTYSYTHFDRIKTLRFAKSLEEPAIQVSDLLAGFISSICVRSLRGDYLNEKLKKLGMVYVIGHMLFPEINYGIKLATSSTSEQFIKKLKEDLE